MKGEPPHVSLRSHAPALLGSLLWHVVSFVWSCLTHGNLFMLSALAGAAYYTKSEWDTYVKKNWLQVQLYAVVAALVMFGGNYAAAHFMYSIHTFWMLGVAAAAVNFAFEAKSVLGQAVPSGSSGYGGLFGGVLLALYQLGTTAAHNVMLLFPAPIFNTFIGGPLNGGEPTKAIAFWVQRGVWSGLARYSGRWDAVLYAKVPHALLMTRKEFSLFRTFTPAQAVGIVMGDMLLLKFKLDKSNRRAGAIGSVLLCLSLHDAGVAPMAGTWLPAAFCLVSFLVSALTAGRQGIVPTSMQVAPAARFCDRATWIALLLGMAHLIATTKMLAA
jgi:hypothetical protein